MNRLFIKWILIIVLINSAGLLNGLAQSFDNAGIGAVGGPKCSPSVDVVLTNFGINDISTLKVGWSVNGVFQKSSTYNQTIKESESVSFILSPNYNFVNGNNYTVKVFTFQPNGTADSYPKNDTLKIIFKYVGPPYGASFAKGSPFVSPQPNTTGTQVDPDVASAGGTLTYNLMPPTGYQNTGYGSTWNASTPVLKSINGIVISKSYWNYGPPTGTTAGQVTFIPDASLVDSCLILTLQVKDIGATFCDSTITRYICVSKTGGIKESLNISQIKVYPNPNEGRFQISIENPRPDLFISIYNLNGEIIKTIEPDSFDKNYTVDLDVGNGLYLIRVLNGGTVSSHKISINAN